MRERGISSCTRADRLTYPINITAQHQRTRLNEKRKRRGQAPCWIILEWQADTPSSLMAGRSDGVSRYSDQLLDLDI